MHNPSWHLERVGTRASFCPDVYPHCGVHPVFSGSARAGHGCEDDVFEVDSRAFPATPRPGGRPLWWARRAEGNVTRRIGKRWICGRFPPVGEGQVGGKGVGSPSSPDSGSPPLVRPHVVPRSPLVPRLSLPSFGPRVADRAPLPGRIQRCVCGTRRPPWTRPPVSTTRTPLRRCSGSTLPATRVSWFRGS